MVDLMTSLQNDDQFYKMTPFLFYSLLMNPSAPSQMFPYRTCQHKKAIAWMMVVPAAVTISTWNLIRKTRWD